MPSFFSDPNLQVVTINDFSPGIVRFSRGAYPVVYSSSAPLGSAASAFRCYAKPGIGLVPFPTYTQSQSFTQSGTGGLQFMLMLNSMVCLSEYFTDGLVSCFQALVGYDGNAGTNTINQWVTRRSMPTVPNQSSTTPTTVFTLSVSNPGTGANKLILGNVPGMEIGEFFNAGVSPSGYTRCALTTLFGTFGGSNVGPYWVSVPDWASNAESNSGQMPTPVFESPRIFYQNNRMGIFQAPYWTTNVNNFPTVAADLCNVSATPLTLQPFTLAGTFAPELGAVVGTWGCVSTGEFLGVYTTGGGFAVYGDILNPTQVVKFPAITGTGNVLGKAAVTPIGLVYATEMDGVQVWNGGNTSEKISLQIPDDACIRPRLPQGPSGGTGISDHTYASQDVWGQWVMFPHNWIYDTTTRSWWNCEDPNVIDFHVHAKSVSSEFFHSGPGPQVNGSGAAITINTYRWDKGLPATSYVWLSNPIPVSLGSLVSLQAVEIVASNPSSTPATLTVTPTVPSGQTLFSNQNVNQVATFTIPANAVASRQSKRLGFTDYNIQLQVNASNTGSNPAPTLHELTAGISLTRTSAVE